MRHTRDPKRVYIFDTTNRDGEQATEGAIYGINSKVQIAHELAKANVDRIEAGFPASSQADFEAVQRIAREVHGPMVFGLARVHTNDRDKYRDTNIAYEAVKDAPDRGIHVFSEMFDPDSLKEYGLTREQVVKMAVSGVAYAKTLLGNKGQVEFSFQNATNSPLEWIVDGYKRVVDAGADVINVPDTVGYSSPEEIKTIITALRKELPNEVMISIHCHDDLGLAVANSLAAVKAGADIVECTVNGIGERAGNTPLEELVMNIVTRNDLYDGRIVSTNTEMLNNLSKLVSYHYNIRVQENKAIVGANAFRHRSGIHQKGMVKGGVYEVIDPKKVGWDGETYELTARSGYAGVAIRLQKLGYTINACLRNELMPSYKKLADEKRTITDADLVWLMDSINCRRKNGYEFVDMTIFKEIGSNDYHASVMLKLNGNIISSSSIVGNGKSINVLKTNGSAEQHGAIDALYSATDQVIKTRKRLYLVSYEPKNIGSGKEAIAEVTVILSEKPDFDGKIRPFESMYIGRARHTDTLQASVIAYIDALNKA